MEPSTPNNTEGIIAATTSLEMITLEGFEGYWDLTDRISKLEAEFKQSDKDVHQFRRLVSRGEELSTKMKKMLSDLRGLGHTDIPRVSLNNEIDGTWSRVTL